MSEVLALKWSDFDFENLTLEVVRGVVHGRISDVMRHAQVAIIMNTYGNAQMNPKRMANSKVVQMVLAC